MTTTSKAASAFHSELRVALVAMVRRRVPESEVEDIVQATLAEAFESTHAPTEDEESLRRWSFGVAKNKVVDYHRRQGRLSYELPELVESPAPHTEADLLRWAQRTIPEGAEAKKTLDWMLREGDGEKLETIALAERLPAPRVRQRVSRLRRHLKDHWQREVGVLAALGVVITGVILFYLHDVREPIARPDDAPVPAPINPRAESIRRAALERCKAADAKACLEGLDEAKRFDPAGDTRPEVQDARTTATKFTGPPVPSADKTPLRAPPMAPTGSASPLPPRPTMPTSKVDSSPSTSLDDAVGDFGSSGIPTSAPSKKSAAPKGATTK